eukprot:gene395-415_t
MRIAPGTPVAKLKEKIQNAMSSMNKARNENFESVLCQRNLSNTTVVVLQDKLCEAEALANLCGITVARKYFEALPNESGLERVTEQPLYWLSWIKLENTSKGQNKVEVIKSLYERALASVKGHASHVALQTAFDCFVETCGKELNKSVRSSPSGSETIVNYRGDFGGEDHSVNSLVAKSLVFTADKAPPPAANNPAKGCQGVFKEVSVENIRRRFEKPIDDTRDQHHKILPSVTKNHSEEGDRFRNRAEGTVADWKCNGQVGDLEGPRGSRGVKAPPPGGVALPGMIAKGRTSSVDKNLFNDGVGDEQESGGGADLADLLGLSNDVEGEEEKENDVAVEKRSGGTTSGVTFAPVVSEGPVVVNTRGLSELCGGGHGALDDSYCDLLAEDDESNDVRGAVPVNVTAHSVAGKRRVSSGTKTRGARVQLLGKKPKVAFALQSGCTPVVKGENLARRRKGTPHGNKVEFAEEMSMDLLGSPSAGYGNYFASLEASGSPYVRRSFRLSNGSSRLSNGSSTATSF